MSSKGEGHEEDASSIKGKRKVPEGASIIGLIYHTRPYLQLEIDWVDLGINPQQIDTFEMHNWMKMKITMKDGSENTIDLTDGNDDHFRTVLDFKRGFEFDTFFDEEGNQITTEHGLRQA